MLQAKGGRGMASLGTLVQAAASEMKSQRTLGSKKKTWFGGLVQHPTLFGTSRLGTVCAPYRNRTAARKMTPPLLSAIAGTFYALRSVTAS